MAIELQTNDQVNQLVVSEYHHDDELGLLAKGYNRQRKQQNSD